nr:polymorphic toxin type 37 domain-containing protein [Nocardia concava]
MSAVPGTYTASTDRESQLATDLTGITPQQFDDDPVRALGEFGTEVGIGVGLGRLIGGGRGPEIGEGELVQPGKKPGTGENGVPTGDAPASLPSIPDKVPGTDFTIPRFNYQDPSQPPLDPGWEWRGKNPPGGEFGGWFNPDQPISLHPDLNHPPPIGPHYDFTPSGTPGWRIFPDGRVEPKPE